MKRTVLIVIIFVAASSAAFAQAGETGLAFLKLGSSPRTIGMGEAGVAGSKSGPSMQYNPSIIARIPRPSVSVMYTSSIQDLSTQFLWATLPLGENVAIGVHAGLTTVDDIQVRQTPGPALGTFASKNLSTGLTFALRLSDAMEAGVTAKYLWEKIYVDEAAGYAFDFGIRYRPFATGPLTSLQTGIALAHVGSMDKLRNEASKLPSAVRAGAAWYTPASIWDGGITFAAEVYAPTAGGVTHLNFGLEFDYMNYVFLRTGYQTNYDDKNISAGLGARYSMFTFDYSFTPWESGFGTAHAIGLTMEF